MVLPHGRHRLQCQMCAKAFWTRYPAQETCSRKCAARYRVKLKGLGGLRPGAVPLPKDDEPGPARDDGAG